MRFGNGQEQPTVTEVPVMATPEGKGGLCKVGAKPLGNVDLPHVDQGATDFGVNLSKSTKLHT